MKRLLIATALASIALGGFAGEAMAKKGSKLRIERSPEYGKILVNGGGKALYLFTKDKPRRSKCFGACAKAWPPYLTKGKPVAAKGLKRKWVGSIKRGGGKRQVTYRGRPLYFYEHDTPSLILCQNVFEFGGLWLLVKPNGRAVR